MSDQFIGEIRIFPWGWTPLDWAPCDGRLMNISENDILYSLLGTTFGGDGQTTFALPDLRGRVPMHQGTGPGLTPRPWGEKGGSETATITANQMPVHNHGDQLMGSSQSSSDSPQGNVPGKLANTNKYASPANLVPMAAGAISQTSAGGGQPHANMQPFLALTFYIATAGVWPVKE
jgi:microcystin-dependent protein